MKASVLVLALGVSLTTSSVFGQLVNPNIPLMFRPPQFNFPDPLQQAQQIEQIRSLQLQNQRMEQERRWAEEQRRQQQIGAEQPRQVAPPPPDPIFDEWLKAAAPRMGLYPDFQTVVFAPDLPITTDMIRLMTPSSLAADIAYYLGKHKLESLAITKLNLAEAARAIDRIEERLKASELPK